MGEVNIIVNSEGHMIKYFDQFVFSNHAGAHGWSQ